MLGIRLEPDVEAALDRHAAELGRTKSAIVRDLIGRHLEAHAIDGQMRQATIVAREADSDDPCLHPDLTIWDD